MIPRRRARACIAMAVASLVLAGCAVGSEPVASTSAPTSTPATSASSSVPTPSVASSNPPSSAPSEPSTPAEPSTPSAPTPDSVLAALSLKKRVGQLMMVGSPSEGADSGVISAITNNAVGSVILNGNTDFSQKQIRAVTKQLQGEVEDGPKLFMSTDQEGGLVQRLQGEGFSQIPSAVEQGQLAPSVLQARWTTWGTQLAAAGINVDLAPVLDTVPANFGPNPPIGDLDRQFGSTPATVTTHGLAVVAGMSAAHVDATVKHFPGLGRVSGNTDTTAGVTDNSTTRHDPYLAPFAAAVKGGVPFVMMSTALYAKIDAKNPAAFSKTIVTGMLRGDLGFNGVVISDDLGGAESVAAYTPGERAVAFINAGGDMVLTVDAALVPEMTAALISRAKSDPAFAKLVNASALRVLTAKAAAGLLR